MEKAWEHSSREWTRGGRGGGGLMFKYICTELESGFLTIKTSSFHHGKVWSLKTWWSTRMDGSVHCFWQLGPSLLCPPRVHLTSATWWMLPGLPHFNFHWSSNSVYCCERKGKIKMREAWDRGYSLPRPKLSTPSITLLMLCFQWEWWRKLENWPTP